MMRVLEEAIAEQQTRQPVQESQPDANEYECLKVAMAASNAIFQRAIWNKTLATTAVLVSLVN